ncbi:carboxymuconolactone decarboxylase family protein [Phreatobacter stygius]|uniref:Carboxymuconolactone decarboxylase family protein n=1 Tax=Phreatobacter stygius TaxID=1940610 RepID=A0A4D7B4Q6_9HYPH|nr:carboxymuconolactone decarboxylase family protein [Phreatobacter stygius]QCI66175.1 carboxymuconolactone decarboxylase family protein [Phreatobacter stygius]
MSRMSPAEPPYPDDVQARLSRIMPPGVPPLRLFTTLARDPRLFERFMSAGLIDHGNLTLRQREIVIDRVTAISGSEYEWGVHVALFAARAGLSEAQTRATVRSGPDDPVWSDEDRLLIGVVDALHRDCDIDDATWQELKARFADEAILEILMLAGFYRMVSYLTNALRLAPEAFAPRFPA